LQISPFTEEHDDTYITVDCAVVSNCNEIMLLTADVLSRIAQCEQAMKVPCHNANQSVCASDTVNKLNASTDTVDADVLLNDDVIDDSVSVDCKMVSATMWVTPVKMLRGLASQMSQIPTIYCSLMPAGS